MQPILRRRETAIGTWDDEHVKALLHFPRFPNRLIQQEPWQSWIGERGGLKAIFTYLQNYPLTPSHRRILDVVLSNPEAVADVYADRLNISRATYFYQLRELVPALVQALNHWELASTPAASETCDLLQPNLPMPLTSLVGVEVTLQTLTCLLLHDDVRLLTLLGPGGIGKTRLSLELAHRFNGATCFVDLSGLHDHTQVAACIALSLCLRDGTDSALKTWLRPREFFLVLDNFEQILPAKALVTALLTAAPRLKILVTSRTALHIYGEHEYIVQPLAIPDIGSVKDQQLWAQSPAVALFVQRAQAVSPGFSLSSENVEAVVELCLRLEGLPLAIELAAFQVKYFSPQAMLARLRNDRLTFLSQGPKRMPPHQQTMRALLDWSFNLLPPDLQVLFCRLSVFSGEFTIADVDSLFMGENALAGLTELVDHSLLDQHLSAEGEPRFQMPGMAREYALDRKKCQPTT